MTEQKKKKNKKSYNLQLITPFSAIIAGSSKSGKSTLTRKICEAKSTLFSSPPAYTVWYYNAEQPELFRYLRENGVVDQLIEGVPTKDEVRELGQNYKDRGGSLIISDDNGLEGGTKDLAKVFSVEGHHFGVSYLALVQNLFPQDPHFRHASRNADYIILMRSIRDKSSIRQFALQFSPGNHKWLVDAYHAATKEPYSHMLISTHQKTREEARVISNIFGEGGEPLTVWLPRDFSLSKV